MKNKLCLLFLYLSFGLSCYAQLTGSLNSMRVGDEIIKQQVDYKNPGKPGPDRFWDFSKLTPVNSEYSLFYSEPGMIGDSLYVMGCDTLSVKTSANLIIGTEHYTMYYYQLRNDSLLQLGHENPNTALNYSRPLVHLKYPFNYGEVLLSEYDSHGSYSGMMNIRAKGTMRTEADAFGKMILPQGDTLTVLRLKSTRLIQELVQLEDSIETYSNTVLETHQWYSKGYRYPVFETVKTVTLGDSIDSFSTAFYYPPQEHFYLDKDPENLAVLDSLWEVKNNIHQELDKTNNDKTTKYRVYPNPVDNELNIEYHLSESSIVTISIYDANGKIIHSAAIGEVPEGMHTNVINLSNLTSGYYFIKLLFGNYIFNEKIIKL